MRRGFVLLSGCEFYGNIVMQIQKGVFVVLAVALYRQVMAEFVTGSNQTVLRDLIVKIWAEGLIKPPVDGRDESVDSRTVRYYYDLSTKFVDRTAVALSLSDGSRSEGVDDGLVLALLTIMGLRVSMMGTGPKWNADDLKYLKAVLSSEAQRNKVLSRRNFIQEAIDHFRSDPNFDGNACETFLVQLFLLCEKATS